MKADAVFEGGGVKGIGLVGALTVAEEEGYDEWVNVAGTSAGAIVASLLAAGYDSSELEDLIMDLDYTKFRDKGIIDRIPYLGPLLSLLREKGVYEGSYLHDWLTEKLDNKGVSTFSDLKTEYEEDKYKYGLRVIAANISGRTMLVLPQDITDLRENPDDLSVAKAVRMSMSIPGFFEPVVRNDSFIVDGGLLSNFPVWLFDGNDEPSWPTFGFKLIEKEGSISGVFSYAKEIFFTMMEAHDERHQEKSQRVRTIGIDSCGIKTTDFNLDEKDRRKLFRSGRKAARKFFDAWDFEEYKKTYRK
ncbi:patatin-like phospholipase family protein [Candidatus Bipolaricaulota bacterium]|nr:patatin-like phospholipase family protein [Candidatus Bipolaricaulota bacterium]